MQGEIVIFGGEPALVLGRTRSGKGVHLKLRRNRFMTVPVEDVKPYEGGKDAVSLGLEDQA